MLNLFFFFIKQSQMKKHLQLKILMLMVLKQTEKDRLHRLWLLLHSLFTEHYAKTQQAQKFVWEINEIYSEVLYILFFYNHIQGIQPVG